MRRIRTTLTFATVFAISLLIFSPITMAEQTAGLSPKKPDGIMELTVSPTSTRLELKAGQSTKGEFMIFNSGEVSLDVKVSANPYSVKNENYDGDYENETPRSQIVRWINFDQAEYHLEPRQQETVHFTVNTPQSIPDGGQYAVLLAETASEATSTEGSSFNTIKRVGTLLYASTDGQTKDSGFVKEVSVKGWQKEQPVAFTQRITNDGNTDFVTTGKATLTSLFGREIATVIVDEQIVLPDTTRATDKSFNEKVVPGFYKLSVESTFLGQTHTSEKWVFVAPVWLVSLVLIIFLLVIAVIIWLAGRGKGSRKIKIRGQ
ncbi:hypothetical protein FWG95_01455 [Candidatus Saccharibacteria bacterium]|nr:hypothetical protein [Candidatus Saccharibacteria bacterium]